MKRDTRVIDEEIQLVPYYPNVRAALVWYQDTELCRQVDNRAEAYDLPRLRRMYRYLNARGDLFYIKYHNRLCGDACLQRDGEINIVIAKPFQNRHIGRRVMGELVRLAGEKGIRELHARIYDFNTQSQAMFRSAGFRRTGDGLYVLEL